MSGKVIPASMPLLNSQCTRSGGIFCSAKSGSVTSSRNPCRSPFGDSSFYSFCRNRILKNELKRNRQYLQLFIYLMLTSKNGHVGAQWDETLKNFIFWASPRPRGVGTSKSAPLVRGATTWPRRLRIDPVVIIVSSYHRHVFCSGWGCWFCTTCFRKPEIWLWFHGDTEHCQKLN